MRDIEKPSDTEQEYFLRKDLELIAELRAKRDADRAAGAATRKCPVDGTVLEAREFHGVIVDTCPSCAGVWLDAGELDALMKVQPSAVGGFLKNLLGR
jgi:Na+-translocating ferredoxin:NAD+ oxidoreductase RNF subunit RnfB